MKNRQLMLKAIEGIINQALIDELEYFLDVEHEYDYDIVDALDDAHDFAENNNDRKLLKVIRGLLIDVRFFTLSPTNNCTRDVRFTYNKEKYDCDESWESWISG